MARNSARTSTRNSRKAVRVSRKVSTTEFRDGSKMATMVDLLSNRKGVSLDRLIDELDWTEHSVRAALNNLGSKHGYKVQNIGERGAPVYKIA